MWPYNPNELTFDENPSNESIAAQVANAVRDELGRGTYKKPLGISDLILLKDAMGRKN